MGSRTRLLLVTATPPTQSLHLRDRDKVRALANRCRSPWLHMCSWRGIDVCSADPTRGGPPFGCCMVNPLGHGIFRRGSGQRKIHAARTEAASGPMRCRGGLDSSDWYGLCVGVLSCPEINYCEKK